MSARQLVSHASSQSIPRWSRLPRRCGFGVRVAPFRAFCFPFLRMHTVYLHVQDTLASFTLLVMRPGRRSESDLCRSLFFASKGKTLDHGVRTGFHSLSTFLGLSVCLSVFSAVYRCLSAARSLIARAARRRFPQNRGLHERMLSLQSCFVVVHLQLVGVAPLLWFWCPCRGISRFVFRFLALNAHSLLNVRDTFASCTTLLVRVSLSPPRRP